MAVALLAFALIQPPFAHSVSRVTAAQLPYSWHRGCPVAPSKLRRIRLRYWGFDRHAHLGALVVNVSVVDDVVLVFSRLYLARFPIRRLRPIDAYHGIDERSLNADNTAGFNCRYVIGPGPKRWSAHAYGLAIDVNPVENPYLERGRPRLPEPLARPPRDGRPRRRARARLLGGGLELGRPLAPARLPALLEDRRVRFLPRHAKARH